MAYDDCMLSRRPMTDRSYRSKGRHSTRTLPAFMDGTKRDTPIGRTEITYTTIPTEEDSDND